MFPRFLNSIYMEGAGDEGAKGGGGAGEGAGEGEGEGAGDEAGKTILDTAAGKAAGEGEGEGTKEGEWSWAENVAGEGIIPPWFKGDKFANVSEQAKALSEVRGPEVPDTDRIARLREAIRNGTLVVDLDRIAEAMINEEL